MQRSLRLHHQAVIAAVLLALARAQSPPPAFQPGWLVAQRLANNGSGNAAMSGFLDVIDPVARAVVYTYALPTAPAGAAQSVAGGGSESAR